MQRIARFERVSEAQFAQDAAAFAPGASYAAVKLPRRATAGSAGYDFCAPVDFTLAPGEEITVPTGIRAWMQPGWVLVCCPRSGLGFKFRLQLNNTVGIIDSDYYAAKMRGISCCVSRTIRSSKRPCPWPRARRFARASSSRSA